MKILLCFGTRPEAIKMAPVISALKNNHLEYSVCVTGQHREMLDQVLDFFEIKPDFDLKLMQKEQGLNSLSALILEKADVILQEAKPDLILVQGDTTTAFIAALAAFNRGIKIGHIEAGLRTQNLHSPFPEEANRQLISRITDFYFVPTDFNRNNLLREGISANKIFTTGNTVIDALRMAEEKLKSGYENDELKKLKGLLNKNKKLLLVTGHRRESFGGGLEEVCKGLRKFAERKDVQIIFPVHLNPQVRRKVFEILGKHPNIHLIDPVSYPSFVWLMMQASTIISDSGGIQEEAPSLKKPVLVTREFTEREEAVIAGFSTVVGASEEMLLKKLEELLENPPDFTGVQNPYGDGTGAQKIVEIIKKQNA
ncbi:UDP-N-acetylglucosamine 2-epimerase (non-hydrolysing) [Salegentibacter holothuriorum]|uniref:UDP-N-acetylglucosamine 2-epimerase (non-hydrolyzing) n=1 Tax=Salegentibacter holothuriorum TaxID=241145 RepID=A0A1T5CLL5_9FLAO|nr:UDP-N-acetylglucosamine 2-epimerase (non-hydrolyzing) [Salegentibacter holothuriorum]SKB60246.1 UDP-N-acetylglucosamine 2-epimerase (non-hydrolysing) [Salegentibacter holothuriorum]